MDASCIAAYEHAVRQGFFLEADVCEHLPCDAAQAARIRDVLSELCLLVPGVADGPPVPANPEWAEVEVSAKLQADIAERQQQLAEVHRQLRPLTPIYRDHQLLPPARQIVRLIEDPAEVRRELSATARACASEVLTVQPGGGRSSKALDEAIARDTAMLKRGVTMRILYQHTARASLATRNYARKVAALGAEVRTAEEIYQRLIIFDQAVAFVPQQREGKRVPGAAVVSEATVVGYLWHLHDNLWDSARPYVPSDPEYASASEEVRYSVLRLMAAGLKDEVIARRLGMSPRTCRRYIAALMEELGANSRFQAGMRATTMGLLKADTDLPEDGGGVPGFPE